MLINKSKWKDYSKNKRNQQSIEASQTYKRICTEKQMRRQLPEPRPTKPVLHPENYLELIITGKVSFVRRFMVFFVKNLLQHWIVFMQSLLR